MLLLLCLAFAFGEEVTSPCANVVCPDKTTLQTCANNEPFISADRCCQLCLFPVCFDCAGAAAGATLRVCEPGEAMRVCEDCTNRTCCPKCKPPTCVTNCPLDLPPCSTDVVPVHTCERCPDCRPEGPVCNTLAITECKPLSVLAECGPENPPVAGCCPNCRPRAPCPPEIMEACLATLATLPECTTVDGAENRDPANPCCFRCKPKPPPEACTEIKTAEAVRIIRDCDAGERPVWFPGQCTFSCRERGSECPPNTVENMDSVPVCPVNVEPSFVACKPTCRPPRPVCAPACLADEACVRSLTGPHCIGRDKSRTFEVKGIDPTANPGDVFDRIVQRHCEDHIRGERDGCNNFEKTLRDTLHCVRVEEKTRDGEVFDVIRCKYEDNRATGGARRLLGSDDLMAGATQNPGATEGLTFHIETSSANALGLSGLFAFAVLLL